MKQKHIYRTSGTDSDPARRHVVLALLQAAHDEQRQVVFGKLCSTCEPVLHWHTDAGTCTLEMPTEVRPRQVNQALASILGLDGGGDFPKQLEFTLQVGDGEIDWSVSIESPETQITFTRIC